MKLVNALKQMKYPFGMFTHSEIKTDLKALKHHFDNLPADDYLSKRHKLSPQKVMRQRRMLDYIVEFDDKGNMATFHENYQLMQYKENQTLQYANLYEEITPQMKQDQNYKDFLYNTLHLIWQIKPFTKASVGVHAVRTISYADQPASPTPEGPNRDGDDLEIIAVVNKNNCQGAESQIFSEDREILLFEMTLEPGEGYICEDQHLWNYATDHKPIDPTQRGIRDIIGYKLKILK